MTTAVEALPLNDQRIRDAVCAKLSAIDALRLVHEWGIGNSCIDVAVIHRTTLTLHGYEIKSPLDSTTRLVQQARDYSRVFATMTLVLAPKLLARAHTIVPYWWGLMLARETRDGGVRLTSMREAQPNPTIEAAALLAVLWHRELRALMQRKCLAWRTLRSKRQMIDRLAQCQLATLQRDVGAMLLRRADWKDVDNGRRSSHFIL